MTTLPLPGVALHRVTLSATEDVLGHLTTAVKSHTSSKPHRAGRARKEFGNLLWKKLSELWADTNLEQSRVHWVALESGSRSDDFSVEFVADTHHPINDEMMQKQINQAILAAYKEFTRTELPEAYTIGIIGTWWQKCWTATVADAKLEPSPVS